MGQINLNDLQKRNLQECYLAWYVINKEVTIRNSTCIEKKMLYLIYGVDIIGNRQIIGTYFENEKDNRFWLETFEDLKARNAQTVLFLVTPEHRNIERCAKIVYNSIKVVHAPDDVIMSITKFFSEKPSRRLTVCFKNLFCAILTEKDFWNVQFNPCEQTLTVTARYVIIISIILWQIYK